MIHLSAITVIAALFLAGLGHANDDLLADTNGENPYFLLDVRTSTLASRDVLSQGIARCLNLDTVSSVPFRSYTTHSLDDSTVVTIQFDAEKYANSMLAYISTPNNTDAAKVCLHDQCNNLVINSIVVSYDPDVVPSNDGTNFFSNHPYVFVGAGAGALMLLIVTIVVIIKRKEKREKDEYVEPLSTMEQGRVGAHARRRQANDVGRPGQRPVVHQATVVPSPSSNATQSGATPAPPQQAPQHQQEAVPEVTPQQQQETVPEVTPEQQQETVPEVTPQHQQEAVPEVTPQQQQETVPEVAPQQQQEAVPEVTPQQQGEVVPPPPAHNNDASLN